VLCTGIKEEYGKLINQGHDGRFSRHLILLQGTLHPLQLSLHLMAWISLVLTSIRNGVQAVIWSHFSDLVSPSSAEGRGGFILVVSFGRCKFQLSEQSVSLILQAMLGGVTAEFRPNHIYGRVFQSLVVSCNVGFQIVNTISFSCTEYTLFFHLWGHGGPNWKLEFRNFSKEEAAQWILVLHKHDKAKSYADAVRSQHFISGANRIPMGRPQYHQDVNKTRIDWLTRQRYVNNLSNNLLHQSVNQPLVFSHISLPHHHKNSQWKGRNLKIISKFLFDDEAKNIDDPCDEQTHNVQNSKLVDKGKMPLYPDTKRPKRCRQCLSRIRPIWHNWTFCRTCSQLGHVQYHCEARWHQTSKQIQICDPGFGKALDPNQASSSKNHVYTSLIDRLQHITTNTAPSPPGTELQLGSRVQNPIQAPQQPSSAINIALVGPSASPGSPQLESTPQSPSMAFQRDDPRPFSP
jgi:hypothetical protein